MRMPDDDDPAEEGSDTTKAAAAPRSPPLVCVDGGGGMFHLMVASGGSWTAPERLLLFCVTPESPETPRPATAPEGAKGTIGPIERLSGLMLGMLERKVVGAAGMP